MFRGPEDWEDQTSRDHLLPTLSLKSGKEVSVVSVRYSPAQSRRKFRLSVRACPTPALWMLASISSGHSGGRAGREAGRG